MARNKYSLLIYLDGAGASRAVKSSEEKDGVEVFFYAVIKTLTSVSPSGE